MNKSLAIIKEGRAKDKTNSEIKKKLDSVGATRANGRPWTSPEISKTAIKMGLRKNAVPKKKRSTKSSNINFVTLLEDVITSSIQPKHKEYLVKVLMHEG